MKAIETSAIVTEDKKVTISVPEEISAGKHKVILIIDENLIGGEGREKDKELNFKIFKWNNWPADCSFKREDIYNDDGR